ncbi:phenylalanine--tRNA ligase subunit beta [Sulfurospirillum sp. 1612]|uniref:phenylalanine--tRNA ligase subunit beta n=1 Tax=Sulfurospirillum sp. 1612 TaxID=3094835 RepID=UPI002F92FA43
MIVTKKWLEEWINIKNIAIDDIAKEFNSIGLEVDRIEKIQMPHDVVVGHVLSCEKHPNADKLNVCQVDIGDKTEQIVCGAKNVASGQMVPVAKVGSVLPGGIKIKEAKLRDIISNGMICSSTELGLPKINDGIMILDESIGTLEVGKALTSFPLLNDEIIELELTANRGDCLSVHGVARDICVPFGLEVNDFEIKEEDEATLGVGRILNMNCGEKIESSFVFKALENREIKSNVLIDLRLSLIGEFDDDPLQRLLTYATHATGVLFRAYDYDKFEQKDGKAILSIKKESNQLDAVFSHKRLSYVGISQEPEEKATTQSTKIILEANYSNPDKISEHSYTLNLKSDRHLYRSTRGSEPDLDFGMNYLISLLGANCDVMVYAGTQQVAQDFKEEIINLHADELTQMIGQEIPKNSVVDILKKLGFRVVFSHEQDAMNIRVPMFRHDIVNKQDICEEVVRIVGIDNIAAKPLTFLEQAKHNDAYAHFKKRQSYRYKAASNGFFESIDFIFDDKAREEKYGLEVVDETLDLANPITSELNTLRSSLILNMLDSISRNTKYGKKTIPFFQIGRVYNHQREETTKIAFVFSGEQEYAQISNHGKPEMIGFYAFARKVSNVIGDFELEVQKPQNKLSNPYEYALVKQNNRVIGYISRLHIEIEKDFDIAKTYIAELDFDALLDEKCLVQSYSNYQMISRDLSVLIPKEMQYAQIKDYINTIKPAEMVDFSAIDIYSSAELGDKVSLTIKFNFQSHEKTLVDEDITANMEHILDALKEKFGIDIR